MKIGDRVLYDDNPGEVLDLYTLTLGDRVRDIAQVQWDNGNVTKEWQSDLMVEGE